MSNKKFSPLIFLASLGAGGIAIMPFALLQYAFPHEKGLVKIADIAHGTLPLANEIYYMSLEAVMVIFTIIHLILTVIFLTKLVKWLKTKDFKEMLHSPLKNAGLLAPFISIIMTMNVFIGPVRFFIPEFASNLQTFMLPALIFWLILWAALIYTEIKLLTISFTKGFDSEKISFGWLLHPFALGMLTVVGTGIAALSKTPDIAHTAAFFSMISGSMGLFLLLVKMIVIFKSHFAAHGLPEKQFMPSFLIVIPNITLFAISAFRIGHYLENNFGYHLDSYFFFVIVSAFAFEVWYMLFGIALLGEYFKKHFFKKEFYVTQWGLVCPVVAFGVLASFVYSTFIQTPVLYYTVIGSIVIASILFFNLLIKQLKFDCS